MNIFELETTQRPPKSFQDRICDEIFTLEIINAAKDRSFVKKFLWLSLIFILFVYPLIHDNSFYFDDYYRTSGGAISLAGDGRPFAAAFLGILSLHHWFIFDIAPLPQLASAVLVALCVSLLTFLFMGVSNYQSSLILSFLFCNFLYIQNLAYRYDSITMSIAVSSAIVVFFFRNKNILLFVFLTAVFTFVTLNFYQPALNIILVFTFLMFFYKQRHVRYVNAGRTLAIRLSSIFIALLAYKIEMQIVVPIGYGARHAGLTDSLPKALQNLRAFFIHVYDVSVSSRQSISLFVLFLAFVSYIFIKKIVLVLYKKEKITDFLVFLSVFILMFVSAVGPMALLKEPIFSPRVLIGFSALFVSICIVAFDLSGIAMQKILSALLVLTLIWQFSLSYAFGNTMRLQFLTEQYISRNVLRNLSVLSHGKNVNLVIEGNEPISSGVKNSERRLPIMKILVPRLLDGAGPGNGWVLGFWNLGRRVHIIVNRKEARKIEESLRSRKPSAERDFPLYVLREYGHYVLLRFHK